MPEKLSRMRGLPTSHEVKFLLDENVSINLKKLLISNDYDVQSVQDLNNRGIKNTELLELARSINRVLITYDKDFLFIKTKIEDSIIVVDIHPLIDDNVLPAFEKLLKKFSHSELKENIVILHEDAYELKLKTDKK